ncbi:TPA: cell division topological specificity factor MinE [Candidatus Poribacteria bacterium]|nr:cell division topological specificity factor MinE [Candidatus Poribacteria bacterium]
MLDKILRFLRKEPGSRQIAKSRLKLVIIQDRTGVDPEIIDVLKEEMLKLLSKYFEINVEGVEVDLHREDESIALVANIPILSMKTRRIQPEEPLQAES